MTSELVFAVLGAGAAAGAFYELVNAAASRRRSFLRGRREPSLFRVIIAAAFPGRFDPTRLPRSIPELIRRSGYLYAGPAEYTAVAARDLAFFLLLGALMSGAALLATRGSLAAAVAVAMVFGFIGLRRPRSRLKAAVKRRAENVPFSLLNVLAISTPVFQSGGIYAGLEVASQQPGVIGNLCRMLLFHLRNGAPPSEAVRLVIEHLPDPDDPLAETFFRTIEAGLVGGQGAAEALKELLNMTTQHVHELVEARAAVAKRMAGLFGVIAVIGMVLSIILPGLGAFLGFGRINAVP